jgi:microcystin-dependent protein
MNFYLGQIGIYGFNFAPTGWAFCAGTILPISQNTALFSLIGTYYGGNGQTTFALPDLRSRTPMDVGLQTSIGEIAGVESVTLGNSEMPAHTHPLGATGTSGDALAGTGHIFAAGFSAANPAKIWGAPPANTVLNPGSLSLVGGSTPHSNIQPSLAVNFCIATTGYYPSRN